jgi:hypothetical protein
VEDEIHPAQEQIERFLLGAGSPDERQLVVLHLVRGCPDCQEMARAAWYRTEARRARLLDLLPTIAHGAPPDA